MPLTTNTITYNILKLDVREIKPYLEKIRVVLVKRGDKKPQFMFETMGLDQMRHFTALGLETVLKET